MPNLFDPVARYANATPGSVAVRSDGAQLTYTGLREASLRYAATLGGRGVNPGDRVLLAAPSTPEFIVAYLGIQALGAVAVTVNTMSTAQEMEYFLTDSGARLAIGWHELGPALRDAADSAGAAFARLDPGAATDAAPLPAACERSSDDTAAILYTSGTTGRPKGAELTVGNLLAAGEIAAQVSRTTAQDRTGTGLPLFHVFGQASVMMSTFTTGGSLSLLARFTGDGMLAMLKRDRLTVMVGVPTMWNAMLHAAGDAGEAGDQADHARFAELRLAVSGGAALPGGVARAFEERFGATILEGYGLTETAAQATFTDIDRGGKTGSVGAVAPRLRIEVRGPADEPLGEGEVGEVHIAGETVTKRYWNRAEATAAAITPDGCFRTGDLGYVDRDGDLHIVDRIKDLIIRGGYNVYPGEVEEALYAHPDIVEAAVVGVPDEHYGEEVAAVVTLRPGAEMTEAAVAAWSRKRLSAYKIPRIVRFVERLPKGSTGKILKRDIDRGSLRREVSPAEWCTSPAGSWTRRS